MPRLRLALEWTLIAILAALAALGTSFTENGQQLSNWMFDQQLAWSQPAINPDILIAQIDEQSLSTIGSWPWKRQVHARIIDRLSDAGVAAVVYDVLFVEPVLGEGDRTLAAAMTRSGRVAVPAYAQFPGSNGRAYDVQMPVPEIAKTAWTIGHVNVLFDKDGLVRRARMQSAQRPQQMPHLVQALVGNLFDNPQGLPSELVIAFNPAGAYPAIPVEKILNGEVPPELLKGKIVLVGATAQGMGDILPVAGPFGSVMSGVEVQANLLNTILAKSWVTDAGARVSAALALCLLVFVMLAFWHVTPTRGLAITIGVGLATILLTALILAQFRVWLSPLPLLFALMIAYPLWNWRRLSALNAFVEQETRALDLNLGLNSEIAPRRAGLDAIAHTADRLRHVIGELRGREILLRDIIESAPDALCLIDDQDKIVMSNRLANQLFGGEAEGAAIKDLVAATNVGQSSTPDELALADGRTFLIKSGPFAHHGNFTAGSIVRLADITDRRVLERERDEALEFLSHDIRTPMASIITALETAPSTAQSPMLTRISGYAARSLQLADDFVHLARLATITPRVDLIDLNGVFEEAIDTLHDKSAAQRVAITLDTIEHLPVIEGDSGLLVRAVGNLIDNAVKFSPTGGVVACRIECDTSGSAVICSIADQGPGIPADRLAALFERFGSSAYGHGYNVGLGLAFVDRVVKLHRATITCRSDAKGTTFMLSFPALTE